MRRLLFSVLLCCALSPLTSAAGPSAQAKSGQVTYTARQGAIFARKGGQEMWRNTDLFRSAESIQMVVHGGKVIVLTIQGKRAILTAFAAGSGARLWQSNVIDEDSTRFQLRGASGNVALMTSTWGPPKIPRVLIISLGSGDVLYKKPGELLGYSGNYAALLDYGINLEVPSDAWLPLVRLDLSRAKRTYIGLTIPERKNCGKVYSRNPGKPDLKYDPTYITALRKDACGLFTVKVNWHGNIGQAIIVSPPR